MSRHRFFAAVLALTAFPVGAHAQVGGTSAAAPSLPTDLSVWGMFVQADWVVKLVMIGLVLASLVTWTVLVAKHLELARQRESAEQFRDKLAATQSLAQLDPAFADHPIVIQAREEIAQSAGSLNCG